MANQSNLNPLASLARQFFQNMQQTKVEGPDGSTGVSEKSPGLGLMTSLKQQKLQEDLLQELRGDLTQTYRSTLENIGVSSGLFNRESASVMAARAPDVVLNYLDRMGYGDTLHNVERYAVRSGYTPPSFYKDPADRKEQAQQNKKILDRSRALFKMVTPDPDTGKIQLSGMKPEEFTQLFVDRPELLENLDVSGDIFDSNNEWTPKGREAFKKKVNNVMDGYQTLRTLTGGTSVRDTFKKSSQLLQKDPIEVIQNDKAKNTIKSLLYRGTQQMGMSRGDIQGMVGSAAKVSEQTGSDFGQALRKANTLLPSMSKHALKGLDDEDRKDVYSTYMTKAFGMDEQREDVITKAAYALGRSQGYNPDLAAQNAKQLSEHAQTPKELLDLMQDQTSFELDPENIEKFANSEWGNEFEQRAEYADTMVNWTQKRAKFLQQSALKNTLGQDMADKVLSHSDGTIPTVKEAQPIINYYADTPRKKLTLQNRLKKAREYVSNRMGVSENAFRRLVKPRETSRYEKMPEMVENVSKTMPLQDRKSRGWLPNIMESSSANGLSNMFNHYMEGNNLDMSDRGKIQRQPSNLNPQSLNQHQNNIQENNIQENNKQKN